jgi:Ser/Thr protein kinase RdoA (MazF antagonist)
MSDRSVFAPTRETASHLIERFQFGPGTGRLSPVARGAMGRIWRLSVAGRDYAVKELFWGADESAVRREVAFRDTAAEAGVVSPANLPSEDGRYVCVLPPELGGVAVRMFSWIEGLTAHHDDAGLQPWMGRTLGVLHSLRYPCDGVTPDPWHYRTPPITRWDEWVEQAEATGQPWAAPLAKLTPLLRSLATHVVPVDPSNLIYNHLDLQPQNVMVEPSGRYVLLDWEDAGPGMPDRVLANLLVNRTIHEGAFDAARAHEVLGAYHRAGGYAALTGLESFSGNLAGYLNYLDAQASVSLDTNQAVDMRDHATGELLGCLADPPRLDLFREVLQCVQPAG